MMLHKFHRWFYKERIASLCMLSFISSVFTVSLLRNVAEIDLISMLAGMGIITLTFIWNSAKDTLGLAFYQIEMAKSKGLYLLTVEQHHKKPSRFRRFLYSVPAGISCVTVFYTLIFSLLFWWFFQDSPATGALLCGGLVVPLLCYLQLRYATPYISLQANEILSSEIKHAGRKAIEKMIFTELMLSLLLNAVMVPPLRYTPDFSLAAGYASPTFIAAFTLLTSSVLLFVLFFMLFRTQRFALFGELLAGRFEPAIVGLENKQPASLFRLFMRWLLWLFLILMFTPLLCLLFALFAVPENFLIVYCVALIPVYGIFIYERGRMIGRDLAAATDMWSRHCYLKALRQQKFRDELPSR